MSFYLGFDLGGTQLKYGLIDHQGKVIVEEKSDTPSQIEALLQLIKKIWNKQKKEKGKSLHSVGFGFPGIFNVEEQKILQSPNYPHIDNFALVPALSQFIEVPFYLNNDANMAAYGEYKQGAGRGSQSMVLLTLGTGVGSGIILEGKLWLGKCGFAGELGHITVNPEGEKCNCGSQGCLETEVSAPKIVRNYIYSTKNQPELTAVDVARRARQGDQKAVKAFQKAGYYLGIGLSIVINFLNPQKIILGGGIMGSEELILPPALQETRKRAYKASFNCCQIIKASLGNKAGFIGAAHWAKHKLEETL